MGLKSSALHNSINCQEFSGTAHLAGSFQQLGRSVWVAGMSAVLREEIFGYILELFLH